MKKKKIERYILFAALVLFYGFCLLIPQIMQYSYSDMAGVPYETMSENHWFGTDALGRDLLVRVCVAARTSIHIAVFSIGCSMVIGGLYGCFSGYHKGVINTCFTALIDIMESIPDFLCAMLLMTFFNGIAASEIVNIENGSLLGIFATLILTSWTAMARIIKNETMVLVEENYVVYAKMKGASYFHILKNHLLPNLKDTIIATTVQKIPAAIFLESFLSFIGIGIQPPYPSLGKMISEGVTVFRKAPIVLLVPSVFLFIIVLLFNLIGNTFVMESDHGE